MADLVPNIEEKLRAQREAQEPQKEDWDRYFHEKLKIPRGKIHLAAAQQRILIGDMFQTLKDELKGYSQGHKTDTAHLESMVKLINEHLDKDAKDPNAHEGTLAAHLKRGEQRELVDTIQKFVERHGERGNLADALRILVHRVGSVNAMWEQGQESQAFEGKHPGHMHLAQAKQQILAQDLFDDLMDALEGFGSNKDRVQRAAKLENLVQLMHEQLDKNDIIPAGGAAGSWAAKVRPEKIDRLVVAVKTFVEEYGENEQLTGELRRLVDRVSPQEATRMATPLGTHTAKLRGEAGEKLATMINGEPPVGASISR